MVLIFIVVLVVQSFVVPYVGNVMPVLEGGLLTNFPNYVSISVGLSLLYQNFFCL